LDKCKLRELQCHYYHHYSLAVTSSRPLPVSSSGVLVVLIKYFNIISQERHELFMSILVHDGKQKTCISTLLTIDFQISLQSSWLFLTQKNSFQRNLDSCFNVETLFKMATCEFNHEWTTYKYNVMTDASLCYSTI
jgi:hypothetical protein